MLLTEFFDSPEGDSYANNQATTTATKTKLSKTATNEHIVKVKGGYRLVSKKTGKNLGTYPTRAGAEKRERQVQYFKHANEDMAVSNLIATEDNHMSDVITAKQLANDAVRNPQSRQKYFDYLTHLRNKHGKDYSTQIHQQATKLAEESWSGPDNSWHNGDEDQWSNGQDQWHGNEGAGIVESDNPTDAVTMDIPLVIRMLEYAREDAQTDLELHKVAERMIALSAEGRTLTIDDYNEICGIEE